MARPASRGRRTREEEPASGRRGRGPAPRKAKGPPMGLLLGGIGAVVVGIVVAIAVLNSGETPPIQPRQVVALSPKQEAPPPVKAAAPAKETPKPLNDSERSYIEDLFRQAQPHVDSARKHAKAGWAHKEKEENDAANDEWVSAKHEFQKAVEIVNEALEDMVRFPDERPGMSLYNDRLAGWQKEMMELPKVNVTR